MLLHLSSINTQYHRCGGHQVPRIVADFSGLDKITPASLFPVGYNYSVPLDKWNLSDQACDYIFTGDKILDFEIPGTLGVIVNAETWKDNSDGKRHYPLFSFEKFLKHYIVNIIGKNLKNINFIIFVYFSFFFCVR